MTVRDRLETYRRKKRRTEMLESVKSAVRNALSRSRDGDGAVEGSVEDPTENEKVRLCEEPEDAADEEDARSEDDAQQSTSTVVTKVTYLLYFILWATLYVIALAYQFGAVYFVLSALVFVCLNTRSGPKKRGEPSAYSVFNPNCEAIEGTLDASQFEREIRYGVVGVR